VLFKLCALTLSVEVYDHRVRAGTIAVVV
jgi:hypothetical protein